MIVRVCDEIEEIIFLHTLTVCLIASELDLVAYEYGACHRTCNQVQPNGSPGKVLLQRSDGQ